MPTKYINMTGRVENINSVRLPNDFTQSTIKDKYIVVKKVRLINNYGQLDIGCSLCGDFVDESQYSYGLIDDFIMCSNEINEKIIHIHNTNLCELNFCFKDYKGVPIEYDDEYYYTLELRLEY